MNKKAVVHLWGGIGNQLFIYSFGEYLRYRYELDVYYDLSSYGTTDIRNLELNVITNNIPEYKTGGFFFTRHTGIIRRISRVFFQAKPGVYYTLNKFDESVLSNEKYSLLYFDGYWQEKKYADWLKENKPKMFAPKVSIPEEIKKYINIIDQEYCASIHIRRGDYLLPQNAHLNVCTNEYYLKAERALPGDKVWTNIIFSDDIEWVRNNLKFKNKTVYVEYKGLSPYWDMYLMSLCYSNIISNSTFSWWGAFLNNNSDKILIAPSKWRNDKGNPPLYYSDWKLIDTLE